MELLFLIFVLPLVSAADPTPCCSSTKFTATLLELGGYVDPATSTPTPIDLTAKIYYDYDDKKLRADRDIPQPDGSMQRVSVINDYNSKQMYTFVGGACTVTNQTAEMTSNCVPSNATFVAKTKIGSATRNFHVNTWRVGPINNMTIKISLTVDHCTPFSESTFGTVNGVITEVNYMFMDFKRSIPDGIFTVPGSCHSPHVSKLHVYGLQTQYSGWIVVLLLIVVTHDR